MAATSPRLGLDHVTVVPADPERDDPDAADADGTDAEADADGSGPP